MAQRVSELGQQARAAIGACEGGALVAGALEAGGAGAQRAAWSTLWAVGKAARAMARGAGRRLRPEVVADAGDLCRGALVIDAASAGHPLPDERSIADAGDLCRGALVIDAASAGHPLPDERSVAAAEQLLAAARALAPDERALLLLSGGASALVGAPVDGLGLDELQAATRALLHGGASIREINVVRRHLTKLGGGKLAAACPGAIDVLALSDVAGDDPATIGSGPASPEPASRAEALVIARRYGVPDAALAALGRGGDNPRAEHPGIRARELSRAGLARDARRRRRAGAHRRRLARAPLAVTGRRSSPATSRSSPSISPPRCLRSAAGEALRRRR